MYKIENAHKQLKNINNINSPNISYTRNHNPQPICFTSKFCSFVTRYFFLPKQQAFSFQHSFNKFLILIIFLKNQIFYKTSLLTKNFNVDQFYYSICCKYFHYFYNFERYCSSDYYSDSAKSLQNCKDNRSLIICLKLII